MGEDDADSVAAVLAGARLARSDPATAERASRRTMSKQASPPTGSIFTITVWPRRLRERTASWC
ncbi:MAG: hypothetical protein WAL40_10880 [Rhodoplanes sp.]